MTSKPEMTKENSHRATQRGYADGRIIERGEFVPAGFPTSDRLTEQRYAERRKDLASALLTAEADHKEAALKFELGQIGDAELRAAEEALARIKSKQIGLDAAWAEAQRLETLEAVAKNAFARRMAVDKLRQLDARRVKAMKSIDRIIASLAPHMQTLREIDSEIIATVRPHSRLLADDQQESGRQLGEFGRDVRDRSRERAFVDGAFYRAGLGDLDIGVQFPGVMGDLDVLFRARKILIESVIRRLVDEEE